MVISAGRSRNGRRPADRQAAYGAAAARGSYFRMEIRYASGPPTKTRTGLLKGHLVLPVPLLRGDLQQSHGAVLGGDVKQPPGGLGELQIGREPPLQPTGDGEQAALGVSHILSKFRARVVDRRVSRPNPLLVDDQILPRKLRNVGSLYEIMI